jgi:hypothetical protein
MDNEQRKTIQIVILPLLALFLFFAAAFALPIILFWDGMAD